MSTAIRIGVLGLTVTFAALLVLRLIIGMLARFTAQPVSDQHAPKLSKKEDTVGAASANRAETPNDDNVPAIIAVLAAMGATPKPGGQIHIEEIPG